MPRPHLISPRLLACYAVGLMALFFCGCISKSVMVTAVVQDAETGQAIPGANVTTDYAAWLMTRWMLGLDRPPQLDPSSGITDAQGNTPLMVYSKGGSSFYASAPNYYSAGTQAPDDVNANTTIGIHLYQKPGPTLTITVPDGFRGPLPLELRTAESTLPTSDSVSGGSGQLSASPSSTLDNNPARQRQFFTTVPPGGHVNFTVPLVFVKVGHEVKFVNAHGEKFPQTLYMPDPKPTGFQDFFADPFADRRGKSTDNMDKVGPDVIAARWVGRSDSLVGGIRYLWIVGTQQDAAAVALGQGLYKFTSDTELTFDNRAFETVFNQMAGITASANHPSKAQP